GRHPEGDDANLHRSDQGRGRFGPHRSRHVERRLNGLAETAAEPGSCSISSNRLYLAMRSLRHSEPVLIWPPPMATAKSAMNGSSVSPDRCETTNPQPASRHSSTAAMVSVTVPIWLSLISTGTIMNSWKSTLLSACL